jgi:hypothetical protein
LDTRKLFRMYLGQRWHGVPCVLAFWLLLLPPCGLARDGGAGANIAMRVPLRRATDVRGEWGRALHVRAVRARRGITATGGDGDVRNVTIPLLNFESAQVVGAIAV